jgi:hypothetical protein
METASCLLFKRKDIVDSGLKRQKLIKFQVRPKRTVKSIGVVGDEKNYYLLVLN